ncbi:MAG: aspartate carbamoyltransferase catalytic subunit [Candidatus Eisenbacteria bacterium]|uniref:Aspartate carbamoyltransferase n=1 Tax=Eiseniibacteriota bacterium TaxID=2212470 RepID=A0A538T1V4_UNCEI|nr:MAG: aspartate carbamoyltransferase catalytic subunit [Candidatus Eisenbacteria bacterium]TMQ57611.1 MAG: aspartate carbamoyltransferase catalytic subunit [Candidatus Eisenbacteria bacterium]
MIGTRKDLLGLEDLAPEEIVSILDTARTFREVLDRPIPKVPSLRGLTAANLFFEASTRTRLSFELAEKRLSADTVNFQTSGSSVSKGESLKDTARNIEAMGIHLVVIRHQSSGAPHYLARNLDAGVINAGDGTHEHPTQGLLDIFTIRERRGKVAGLRVAIIGDIAHSRVARSNIWGLTKLGASVTIAGPSTMMPMEVERFGIKVAKSVEEAIEGADVVNILRIQLERQRSTLYSSLREYARVYGITSARLKGAKPDVTVMHPGPMNRGVEIAQDVADGEHSVILEQVTNGVAVRMAVLYLLAGHKAPDESAAEHPMPKETKKAHGEPSLHPRR